MGVAERVDMCQSGANLADKAFARGRRGRAHQVATLVAGAALENDAANATAGLVDEDALVDDNVRVRVLREELHDLDLLPEPEARRVRAWSYIHPHAAWAPAADRQRGPPRFR
jgi:hypothetical protein